MRIAGFALWLGFLFVLPGSGVETEVTRILGLALFVVIPLGLDLSRPGRERPSNMFAAVKYLQPFAAVVAASAFLLPAGVLAGTLAIAWLPLTGLLAIDAFARILKRGFTPLEELAVDVAGLYLPVGALWLWASRMGFEPFGFTEPIVVLTAVHFHFAGFAGPVLAGLAGRRLRKQEDGPSPVYAVAVALILAGPALVAAGFFLPAWAEALAVALLAAGYTVLALIILFRVIRSIEKTLPRLMLVVSSLSILLAVAGGVLFAAGNASRMVFIPIETMVLVHGWVNAVGFVLLGLLGWVVVRRDAD
ncbi:MAG TPA: YndJ family protein [Anaerolineales bacterium]|nr:YndJ family protein [Anaerolineales bacterium]